MYGVQKFYPTAREGFRRGAAWGIGIVVAGLGFGAVNDASMAGLAQASGVGLLLGLAVTGAFFAIVRFSPVTLTTQGVMASSPMGRTRLVTWNEIVRVTPYHVYAFRMLRIDRSLGSYVVMPMHLDNLSRLFAFVSEHAGPTHPLTQWLAAQQIDA